MKQTALRIVHGSFGRIMISKLSRSLICHAHRHCLFLYKCGGPDTNFGVRNKEYSLEEKSVILLNSWEPQYYNNNPDRDDTLTLSLYVEPEWLRNLNRRFLSSLSRKVFKVPVGLISSKTAQLRDDICILLMYDVDAEASKIESLFQDLVISTIDEYSEWCKDEDSEEMLTTSDWRIRRVLKSIKENAGFGVDTDSLVAESGLSRAHFFELFKQQTGVTPHVYANSLRLEMAIKLILQNDCKLNIISDNLEFGSQAEFTSFFKRHIGIPPSQYRRIAELIVNTGCRDSIERNSCVRLPTQGPIPVCSSQLHSSQIP